jgi:hypothetical protein
MTKECGVQLLRPADTACHTAPLLLLLQALLLLLVVLFQHATLACVLLRRLTSGCHSLHVSVLLLLKRTGLACWRLLLALVLALQLHSGTPNLCCCNYSVAVCTEA